MRFRGPAVLPVFRTRKRTGQPFLLVPSPLFLSLSTESPTSSSAPFLCARRVAYADQTSRTQSLLDDSLKVIRLIAHSRLFALGQGLPALTDVLCVLHSTLLRTNMTSAAPSSELRTSVLNAAIDLGFRTSVFAKWMIDPVDEEGAVREVSYCICRLGS